MIKGIFPIVTYAPDEKQWRCLGTGFFINPVGGFITAKHLFIDLDGSHEPTLYAIQSFGDERHLRVVTKLFADQNSDVMMGTLGARRLPVSVKDIRPENNDFLALDLDPLSIGDEINTIAYPNTLSRNILSLDSDKHATEFTFNSVNSKGKIIDFHDRTSLVANKCYQTSMRMDGGASGGPVFRGNFVVGINSSSYKLENHEEPISFVTPISFILDFTVKEKEKEISVADLIKNGHIKVKGINV